MADDPLFKNNSTLARGMGLSGTLPSTVIYHLSEAPLSSCHFFKRPVRSIIISNGIIAITLLGRIANSMPGDKEEATQPLLSESERTGLCQSQGIDRA